MIDPFNGILTVENVDPNKAIPLIRLALFNMEENEVMDEAGALDVRPLESRSGRGVEIYVTNMTELADYYGINNEAKVNKMFQRLIKKMGPEIQRDLRGYMENATEEGKTKEVAIKELETLLKEGDEDFAGWIYSTFVWGDQVPVILAFKSMVPAKNPLKLRNESIAYADLPWAEKQQNTLNEQKMQKLFPSKRLDEAMERLFEDAPEKREPEKFEEDYIKD
jgi:hypothetical protein